MKPRLALISLLVLPALLFCAHQALVSVAASESAAPTSSELGLHERLLDLELRDVDALAARFREEQFYWLNVALPGTEPWVQPAHPELLPFDPKGFPQEFLDGLIPTKSHGVSLYTVQLVEDPATREITVYNALGDPIHTWKPAEDYDWQQDVLAVFADRFLGVETEEDLDATLAWLDPARVQVVYTLIASEDLEAYLQAEAEEKPPESGVEMLKFWEGGTVTNLILADIERLTNGIQVTLAYPNDFTNRVDFFLTAELQEGWWDLGLNTNVSSSTNWIAWLDTLAPATNGVFRCYAAGNAGLDTDADGLWDAREFFMYHSSPTNTDSDNDGLSDYFECLTNHTDPNNDDTIKPTVWLTYPSNGMGRVWLP